eukprot:gene18912-38042_t
MGAMNITKNTAVTLQFKVSDTTGKLLDHAYLKSISKLEERQQAIYDATLKDAEEKILSASRKVAATIVVERDGHKGMIIGEKGEKLKRIGTEARHELETLTGGKVVLEIWVKV